MVVSYLVASFLIHSATTAYCAWLMPWRIPVLCRCGRISCVRSYRGPINVQKITTISCATFMMCWSALALAVAVG
jgi:hypothetical protein